MTTKSIFEENPKKTIGIIIVIIFLLVDISFAITYRLYFGHNFHDNKLYEQQQLEHSYRIKSDIYHHDLQKNIDNHAPAWGGIEYKITTDSLGFKTQKPGNTAIVTDKYRIVFIGDSFTEGVGVMYERTFVGQIAKVLSDRNIDVLNAAVMPYSPIVYYNKIKYLLLEVGLKFDELVVFIDISDVLDEVNRYTEPTGIATERRESALDDKGEKDSASNVVQESNTISMASVKSFLPDNSIFIYELANIIYDHFKVRRDGYNLGMRQSMWTIDDKIYQEYGELGLIRATHHMNLLYNLLEENDVKLTVAVYPWPDQIVNNDLNSIQVKHWQAWAEEKDVEFLNYFPLFIKDACDETCRYQVIEDYYIKGDTHWNANGHKLISDEFLSTVSTPN
ncbi:MAG: hypothetical protein HOM55_00050 [Proteobacteria bacterium]|nr:hypothetical protein [Pseudomonadota bacterium]